MSGQQLHFVTEDDSWSQLLVCLRDRQRTAINVCTNLLLKKTSEVSVLADKVNQRTLLFLIKQYR